MDKWGEGQVKVKGRSLRLGHWQLQPMTVPLKKEVTYVACFEILVRKRTTVMKGICTSGL